MRQGLPADPGVAALGVGLVPPQPHAPAWSQAVRGGQALPRPGPVHGPYPIRPMPHSPSRLWWAWCEQQWRSAGMPRGTDKQAFTRLVQTQVQAWSTKPQADFAADLTHLRAQLGMRGLERPLVAQALGAVGAVVHQQLGWQVHEVQWLGAWWMLGGRLIEMATGEGKSLTVVLASSVAALAQVPVHVMTANDYLARRDAQQWQPVYEALGLSVGWITAGSTPEDRRHAYAQDLVYVTAREVVFDHLRDQAASANSTEPGATSGTASGTVMRGLCMAVIDEADAILIDEACTPLVLSQAVPAGDAPVNQRLALFMARALKRGVHFEWSPDQALRLLPEGRLHLDAAAQGKSGPWRIQRYREEQALLALTALHVLQRDVDYLVRDDAIHLIDGPTGRLAQGRAWSRGLHQMVCLKEGVSVTSETQTLNQTTYQTFFPRYHRLCGLSGTLWEERFELMATYGLPVVRMPLRQPRRLQDKGLQVLSTEAAQWQATVQAAQRESQAGRAVLVGVGSVAESDALSRQMKAHSLAHQLLNARHDEEQGDAERAVIALAGQAGAITVATHMAGRGTDIHLSEAVLAGGGLHVINTHLNASGRVDRQLSGRAARQGQPGSFEFILREGDHTLAVWQRWPWVWPVARACSGWWRGSPSVGLQRLCQWAQGMAGGRACHERWQMLQVQQAMRRQLKWTGRDEWL
jgi:preprotein translocase subunit SecA